MNLISRKIIREVLIDFVIVGATAFFFVLIFWIKFGYSYFIPIPWSSAARAVESAFYILTVVIIIRWIFWLFRKIDPKELTSSQLLLSMARAMAFAIMAVLILYVIVIGIFLYLMANAPPGMPT